MLIMNGNTYGRSVINISTVISRLHQIIVKMILLLLLTFGGVHAAFAGPIEIQSIQIVPTEAEVGKHPEITGSIKADKVNATAEARDMVVIAAVVRPDHIMKSWTWKNVSMQTGEIRTFTIPKEYEINLVGTYKVDFNVYTKDMMPLHRLSKMFVAVDPALAPAKAKTPEKDGATPKVIPSGQVSSHPTEYPHVGVGAYANVVNPGAGATMLLWPFINVGLQGSYTVGTFTTIEGRLLARLPLSSGINPYLGVGYLNVTKEADVIGVKTTFQDSGVSGVVGAEIPLGKGLFGYVEMSAAAIDLKKEVVNGGTTAHSTVKYSPVSVGIGIVYFLF